MRWNLMDLHVSSRHKNHEDCSFDKYHAISTSAGVKRVMKIILFSPFEHTFALLSGFNVSNAQRKLLLWFKVELFLLLARCERVMPWSDNKYVSWNSDVFYSLFCHDLKLLGSKYYRISRHKINFTKEMESIIVKNSKCPINHKSWYGLYTKSK